MKKQIGCKHEEKWCYTFKIKDEIIDFCEECYKKLLNQMKEHESFVNQFKKNG